MRNVNLEPVAGNAQMVTNKGHQTSLEARSIHPWRENDKMKVGNLGPTNSTGNCP